MIRYKTLKFWLYGTITSLCVLPTLSYAQSDTAPLQPRIDAGVKAGTERTIGVTEAWLPVVQSPDKVLYSDIRWMADDNSDQEGNLGIGYRQLNGDQIVGVHGWIDRRRTDRGSNFYQFTSGIEYLRDDWDAKANVYLPLNDTKTYTTPNLGSTTPYLANTGLYFDTNGQVIEEAQPGADIELGYRLPVFENQIDSFRVYAGGYHFSGRETSSVTGGRVRASVDVNPWLNIGARAQYDNVRDGQGFLEATLRFPITAKQRFQEKGLHARLDESPERDIDIVTGSKTDSGLMKPVLNAESGTQQRVLHVDNTAASGGDGSKDRPFNTLTAAQTALQAHDVLYIHSGNGTTTGMNQGLVINKNDVQVIGSGTDFVYDAGRFSTNIPGLAPANGTLIASATSAPLITNTLTSVSNITGNGVLIRADNVSVSGLNVGSATHTGIYALAQSGETFNTVTISNNITHNNASGGINVTADTGGHIAHVTVENNTSNTNTGIGIYTVATNGSMIQDVTVQHNTANSNTAQGIFAQSLQAGSLISNVNILNNTANTNTDRGIATEALFGGAASSGVGGAVITNATMTGNIANGNLQHGLMTASYLGKIVNLTVANNSAANNSLTGIWIQTTQGQYGTVNAYNNIATLNHQYGMYFTANFGGGLGVNIQNLTVSNNQTNSNAGQGLYVANYAGAGMATALLENNTSSNNTGASGQGISVYSDYTFGSIELKNNTANANATDGIYIQGNGTGTLSSSLYHNTATNNGGNGVFIDDDTTAAFVADLGGGSLNSMGSNRIYGNTTKDIRVDLDGGQLKAENNWWGVNTGLNTGTRATLDVSSTIDATPFLTADPGI